MTKEEFEQGVDTDHDFDSVADTELSPGEKGDLLHIHAGKELDDREYLLEPKHRLVYVAGLSCSRRRGTRVDVVLAMSARAYRCRRACGCERVVRGSLWVLQ